MMARRGGTERAGGERGQALVLIVGALAVVLIGAALLGQLARAVGAHGGEQRAADLGALAAARTMRDLYPRLFEPEAIDGRPNPRHLDRVDYLAAGRARGESVARSNGAEAVAVSFPGADAIAPVVVRVAAGRPVDIGGWGDRRSLDVHAAAEAELSPGIMTAGLGDLGSGDEYRGPFAIRQGKPMRPDTAQAFDRMEAAAARDGVHLIVVSGFRSNAEQARLFAAHPDPKWVAPPGQSLHRLGTELDLGPPAAYGWLHAHAGAFGFIQRYSWEPWHFGLARNTASSPAMANRRDGDGALPSFVPAQFADPISRASQRWSVSATLLAAQLYQESKFNPFARSPAGALGIAQFMPATAASYGLGNPFDAAASIDAQAHLMRDLLREFGSVPLALAAYNAGPDRVRRCGCVPPIPETLAYVASILGLMRGAGDPAGLGGLEVRLVR
jgi:hypothetical protein